MKKRNIFILGIFSVIVIFLILNSKTKLFSNDINPIIKEKIIVSQYDFLNKKEVGNYYIDIKNEKAIKYTGLYNTGSIIDELETDKNFEILHNKKFDIEGIYYTYKTEDGKYLIGVGHAQFTKFGIRFPIGAGSLYIIDLKSLKFKQIYIEELNKDNKYIDKIIGIIN